MVQLHATCILINGHGVLLSGPPGSGKSDLALRLIDEGAQLVADDRTDIEERDGQLHGAAPAEIAGQIEVRGLGIVRMDYAITAPLRLAIELDAEVERLPAAATLPLLGRSLPLVRVAPFEVSAAAKVRLALRLAVGDSEYAHD